MSFQENSQEIERGYAVLSFVSVDGSLWAPERTGSYARDCELGRFYARELTAYMDTADSAPLLGQVCRAMSRDEWSGVETGFFAEIADATAPQFDRPAATAISRA